MQPFSQIQDIRLVSFDAQNLCQFFKAVDSIILGGLEHLLDRIITVFILDQHQTVIQCLLSAGHPPLCQIIVDQYRQHICSISLRVLRRHALDFHLSGDLIQPYTNAHLLQNLFNGIAGNRLLSCVICFFILIRAQIVR